MSVLVVAGALVPVSPVHDAVTGAAMPGASLVLPTTYVALAPLCDLADLLAGLPLHAHYALMLGVLAGVLANHHEDGTTEELRAGQAFAEFGTKAHWVENTGSAPASFVFASVSRQR